jgi:hypothetical protein
MCQGVTQSMGIVRLFSNSLGKNQMSECIDKDDFRCLSFHLVALVDQKARLSKCD